jgi:hypothetical protein
LNLCKNKRPPSRKGEVDLHMDPNTGIIRPMRDEDLVMFGVPLSTAADALKANRQ